MVEKKRIGFTSKEIRNKAQSNYRANKKTLSFTLSIDEFQSFEKKCDELGLSKIQAFKKMLETFN